MTSYISMKHLCGVICVAIVIASLTSAAPSYADYDSNIRELLEYITQKEGKLDDRLSALHQIVRKSSRTPSLRLRFGRRSDPSFFPGPPYMMTQQQDPEHMDN